MTENSAGVPVSHYGDRYVGIFAIYGRPDMWDAFVIMHADSKEAAEDMMRAQFSARWDSVRTWHEWMNVDVREVIGMHRVRITAEDEALHDDPIRTVTQLFEAYK